MTKVNKNNKVSSADEIALRGRELDQLCRFSGMLGTALDTETLISDSLESFLAMASADGIMIALAEEDAKVLKPIASKGWGLPPSRKSLPAPSIASLGTEAVAFCDDAELPAQLSGKLGVLPHPFAVVPLWAHARLRGVAVLVRREASFGSNTLKLLTAAGRQLALAVENSQLLADLQKSYRQLMDAQEELIRSERLAALGQLSATMAHEIRNPLATIFSAISQIRKHSTAQGVTPTLLDIAEEEATRLNRMVGGLLEFARPRKPAFNRRELGWLAEESIKVFKETNEVPDDVSIALSPDSVEVTLNLDPDLVMRALGSLILNAVMSMEESGGAVTLKVGLAQTDGFAAVEVSDQGVGIGQEALSKVCDPFFSTRPSGTGLGLPTVKRIAEDHRGTLEIETEPGRGTTVRLLLSMSCEEPTVKETAR